MIAKLLISPSVKIRALEIERILAVEKLSTSHPDVLFFDEEAKLGIEQAKQIKQHLSLKPYSASGRVVVIVSADNFTIEAQNALLKTLEEPPETASLILGVRQDGILLPTISSRAQLHFLDQPDQENQPDLIKDIETLRTEGIEERFAYIDKLEQKEQFLSILVKYFHDQLGKGDHHLQFIKLLIRAQQWQGSNVNLRAILEYLMLNLPTTDQAAKK